MLPAGQGGRWHAPETETTAHWGQSNRLWQRPVIPAEALNTGRRQLPSKESRKKVKTFSLGVFSQLSGFKSSKPFPGLGECA